MKYIVLALFAVAAIAAPTSDNGEPVELIVNGVPEGHPLDIGDIVDINVKKHVDGVVASNTDLLYPLTSAGIAEAALAQIAAEEAAQPVAVIESAPEPEQIVGVQVVEPTFVEVPSVVEAVVVDTPVAMQPIELPAPSVPEVAELSPEIIPPSPIVLPAPEPAPVIPELGPSVPETVPSVPESVPAVLEQPEPIPVPAAQVPGEVFNNGLVQVQVNAPEEAGMFSTIQSWFSLVVNYISNGIQMTQNIV